MPPLEKFTHWLETTNSIPTISQNLTLALLTILIPLSIAILQEIYQKREKEKGTLENLDMQVLLHEIFRIPFLLFFTAIIFLVAFLWDVSTFLLRIILLFVSLASFFYLCYTVLNEYKWIVEKRVWSFRLNYLKSLKNNEDLKNAWHSVWQAKTYEGEDVNKLNFKYEVKFWEVFSKKLDKLLPYNEFVPDLLNNFLYFIENRSIKLLVSNCLPKILDWHFKVFEAEKEIKLLSEKDKSVKELILIDVSQALDSIFLKIQERSFKESEYNLFFAIFKQHIEKHKQREYLKTLLATFYEHFFNFIETHHENLKIWRYFPNELKITKSNIYDKENFIFYISMGKFFDWALKRIYKRSENFDNALNEVMCELFPDVDPIIWSKILLFYFLGCNVEAFIKHPLTFGLLGKPHTDKEENLIESWQRKEIELEKNTFELALLLFPNEFSKENFDKYINELKNLKCENEKEKSRAFSLLNILEKLQKYSDKK